MKKNDPAKKTIDSNLLLKILCHDLGNSITLIQSIISKWERTSSEENKKDEELWIRIKKINTTQRKIISYVRSLSNFIDKKDVIPLKRENLNLIISQCKELLADGIAEKNIKTTTIVN